LSARGEFIGEAAERLERIAKLFGVEAKNLPTPSNVVPLASNMTEQAKVS
jgi:hypothetical protein